MITALVILVGVTTAAPSRALDPDSADRDRLSQLWSSARGEPGPARLAADERIAGECWRLVPYSPDALHATIRLAASQLATPGARPRARRTLEQLMDRLVAEPVVPRLAASAARVLATLDRAPSREAEAQLRNLGETACAAALSPIIAEYQRLLSSGMPDAPALLARAIRSCRAHLIASGAETARHARGRLETVLSALAAGDRPAALQVLEQLATELEDETERRM
jgi:hypothetical protein